MKEKELKNEGLADLAHKVEKDHEVQMARAELYKIGKYAIKLHEMLKGVSEQEGLEGWVQSKITKAGDYLSSVYHHMDYEQKFEQVQTEAKAKPDFLDMDKDGNKKEPMKKAIKDKEKKKVGEAKDDEKMPSKAHIMKMCKDGKTKKEICDMHPNCDQEKLKKMIDDCKEEMKESYADSLKTRLESTLKKRYKTLEESVGKAITEEEFDLLAEKQDACYHKVKSRYKVWPSAYASGALVQCRKKGAKNWGNKSK